MNIILIIIDWISELNRWQLTLYSTAFALSWLTLVCFFSGLLCGGYPGDRTKEDNEAEGDK